MRLNGIHTQASSAPAGQFDNWDPARDALMPFQHDLLSPEAERELMAQIKSAQKELLDSQAKSPDCKIEDMSEEGKIAFRRFTELRNRMVMANYRLVKYIANWFLGQGVSFDDLTQAGNLGVMKAIEKFDLAKGFKFSTYATWRIRQSMQKAVAAEGPVISCSTQVIQNIRDLDQETPRKRSLESRQHARLAKNLKKASSIDTLVAPSGSEGETFSASFLTAKTPEIGAEATQQEGKMILTAYLGRLKPREQQVLRLRFGLDGEKECTLEGIGERLSICKERVRQIQITALKRLEQLINPTARESLVDVFR